MLTTSLLAEYSSISRCLIISGRRDTCALQDKMSDSDEEFQKFLQEVRGRGSFSGGWWVRVGLFLQR